MSAPGSVTVYDSLPNRSRLNEQFLFDTPQFIALDEEMKTKHINPNDGYHYGSYLAEYYQYGQQAESQSRFSARHNHAPGTTEVDPQSGKVMLLQKAGGSMDSKLKQRDRTVARFQAEFSSVQATLAELQVANAKLKQENISLQKELSEGASANLVRAEEAKLAHDKPLLEKQRKQLAKIAKKLGEEQEKLAKEKKDFFAALDQMEQRVVQGGSNGRVSVSYSFVTESAGSDASQWKGQISDLKESIAALEAMQQDLLAENQNLLETNNALTSGRAELQAQLDKQNLTVRSLAKQNALLRNQHKTAAAAVNSGSLYF
mmetsp:Transcript_50851/g.99693  ORF Transcript_50851/g.99693 Transcript_50851/m.99693 type:complete len:317 (-) Transcript_50851:194-1144(-)